MACQVASPSRAWAIIPGAMDRGDAQHGSSCESVIALHSSLLNVALAMSPKRLAHVYDVPESAAARWRRLCPDWDPPGAAQVAIATTPMSTTEGVVPPRGSRRPAPYPPASANHYTSRSDAPVVRHVRRGTTVAAVPALAAYGSIALVEALLQIGMRSRLHLRWQPWRRRGSTSTNRPSRTKYR